MTFWTKKWNNLEYKWNLTDLATFSFFRLNILIKSLSPRSQTLRHLTTEKSMAYFAHVKWLLFVVRQA